MEKTQRTRWHDDGNSTKTTTSLLNDMSMEYRRGNDAAVLAGRAFQDGPRGCRGDKDRAWRCAAGEHLGSVVKKQDSRQDGGKTMIMEGKDKNGENYHNLFNY